MRFMLVASAIASMAVASKSRSGFTAGSAQTTENEEEDEKVAHPKSLEIRCFHLPRG